LINQILVTFLNNTIL